ncbi:hypothetical protein LCGC14_0934390 [marine sediment metagenome]|uniref:Uncharacterized protein n=1 Tax=marine sediment metagenome TaxID=412755 RepID=A0A0F9NRF3_9ZZZZ|nr:MAG: hypothetical protein Lokiarch_49090 [Candidatus Lokiarchaeum sp. GC14_75]
MKKINYSLRIGIVGNKELIKEIFLSGLRSSAIEFDLVEGIYEIFLVYDNIPIKVKIFLVENLEELVNNFERIEKLDVIILTVDLFDSNSIYQYYQNIIEEFNETYYFQGISILVGIDFIKILKKKSTENLRVSRYSLEDMAKYLNLIYCYEISNKNEDVIEIYKKIFKDFLFRFQFTSPELYEQARSYGKTLEKGKKG